MEERQLNNSEIVKQKEYIEKIKEINKNKTLFYYILTMGCQLNENDSEKLCGMLEDMGYKKCEDMQEADLILFNTCCVRENAEDKLFGKIGEAKKIKEEKGAILAIGGCMMQEKHIIEKLNKSYPFCDILFGTHTLHKFPEDLYQALQEKRKQEDIIDIDGVIHEGLPIKRESSIKASVTIMNGCNNFCSYCIVPYVRGRERSRKPRAIIEEVKELPFSGTFDLSDTEIGSVHPFVSPVAFSGTVKPFAGEAQMEATVSFTFEVPCDRCTEIIRREFRYEFSHMLVRKLNQEDNDDYIVVEDEKIDVEALLRDDILLELPTKFLCKPDCKGLCSQCGQNLNLGDCGCNQRRIDPRLEVLQQFFNN